MLHRKSKTQFENRERNKAIALLNCFKRAAQQQLVLKTQIFTKKNFKRKESPTQLFLIKKIS
jgi:hypothetical protein